MRHSQLNIGMKLPTLPATTKARIKHFLLSLTSTTQRKIVASAIIAGLGAIGITTISPETVETVLSVVGMLVTSFSVSPLNPM